MIGEMEYMWYILIACLVAGSIAAIAVIYTATDGSHTTWRMARCFGGFTCSMVWIAAIADEVVSVLQVSSSAGGTRSSREPNYARSLDLLVGMKEKSMLTNSQSEN